MCLSCDIPYSCREMHQTSPGQVRYNLSSFLLACSHFLPCLAADVFEQHVLSDDDIHVRKRSLSCVGLLRKYVLHCFMQITTWLMALFFAVVGLLAYPILERNQTARHYGSKVEPHLSTAGAATMGLISRFFEQLPDELIVGRLTCQTLVFVSCYDVSAFLSLFVVDHDADVTPSAPPSHMASRIKLTPDRTQSNESDASMLDLSVSRRTSYYHAQLIWLVSSVSRQPNARLVRLTRYTGRCRPAGCFSFSRLVCSPRR